MFARVPFGVAGAIVRPLRLLQLAAIVAVIGLQVPAEAQDGRTWSDYGGGPDSSRFSTARQITKANVSQLQIAWQYPTQENGGSLFSPVTANGVLFVLARNSSLVAVDATTGKELWIHEGLQGIAGRGINYWQSRDGRERRLLFQIRNQLQAIDARTGLSITTFGNNGYVDLREGLGRPAVDVARIQSGTPGKIFEDLIILGSSTGEGFLAPPGDLRAFDVRTGKLAWQFGTIPKPGQRGYDTWPKDAYRYIGGVNTWGEISVDARRGIAYFPVGSPTSDFYGADRTGDNLFSDCVLALDARTGAYKWHFQQVHHDLWDYDPVSAPQLVTVRHNGRNVDVVAQAGKTGFLYVLDRETGKPIWPIEERPVPPSAMRGEHASPTQPVPTVVPPFARLSFTEADVNPLLPKEAFDTLRTRVRNAKNQGLFTPPALVDTVSMPGNRGGSNWGTTAANPAKGLVYVLSVDAPSILKMEKQQPVAGGIGGAATFLTFNGPTQYRAHCAKCHGENRQGTPEGPSLADVGSRVGADAIMTTIKFGNGRMEGFGNALTDPDYDALVTFLAGPATAAPGGGGGGRAGGGGRGAGGGDAGPGGRGAGPGGAPISVGPVVASGGAPAGLKAEPSKPNTFGSLDGPAYPAGLDVPAESLLHGLERALRRHQGTVEYLDGLRSEHRGDSLDSGLRSAERTTWNRDHGHRLGVSGHGRWQVASVRRGQRSSGLVHDDASREPRVAHHVRGQWPAVPRDQRHPGSGRISCGRAVSAGIRGLRAAATLSVCYEEVLCDRRWESSRRLLPLPGSS